MPAVFWFVRVSQINLMLNSFNTETESLQISLNISNNPEGYYNSEEG